MNQSPSLASTNLSTPPSSVDVGTDGPVYYLDGPPAVSFSIKDELLEKVEGRAQLAARWIYAQEERDADVRHLLYSTELARSFRASGLGDLGLSALESAQSAYRAYIKSKSAETLQALSKLRQSVLEETQKISERGHEFTKNLWRDGVVAATPFLLRLVSAPNAESAAAASKVIALGIAIFLLVSIASQWYLNERWLASQRQSRGIWRFDLNTALTSDEIKKVIEDPVSRTVFDYRAMGSIVSAVYAVAIASLVSYSFDWLSLPA